MGYRVAVAGASGYAGGELLRLLAAHPDLDVIAATAHDNAGQPLGAVHPQLRSLADLVLADTVPQALAGADLVFLALPHGASGSFAPQLPPGVKIVDLGADHRLTDAGAYERYYGGVHPAPGPTVCRNFPGSEPRSPHPSRVANTGCYAVAIALAVAPLIAAGVVERDDLVVVAASGTSGAGRAVKANLLASEVIGDLSPYKVGSHQHVPEILQCTGATTLSFTPVLAPMPRGILASVAARPARFRHRRTRSATCSSAAYGAEPFVHVLPPGEQPHTAAVAGSNSAHLQAATRRRVPDASSSSARSTTWVRAPPARRCRTPT